LNPNFQKELKIQNDFDFEVSFNVFDVEALRPELISAK